jgi:hypothetical protein
MNAFDLDKLQEQKSVHTVEPTMEFWQAEMERCKDTSYYFEHYWLINGKSPDKEAINRLKEHNNMLKYYGDNIILLKSRFVPPLMDYEGTIYPTISPKRRNR